MVCAVVSLIIGCIENPDHGYIEGVAIWIAIFLVAIVTAGNDYTKELQFRKLEKDSQSNEATTVMRGGKLLTLNPSELVVGDCVVLTSGCRIPADCVLIPALSDKVEVDESALTGERASEPRAVVPASSSGARGRRPRENRAMRFPPFPRVQARGWFVRCSRRATD